MKVRCSLPLRNGPETARSISVGRFRPVVLTIGNVARFRSANPRFREIWPKMARPPRLERGTPGLDGPSSKTLQNRPIFADLRYPIGYHRAVIGCGARYSRDIAMEAGIR